MDRKIEILVLTNGFFKMAEENQERILKMMPGASITVVKYNEATEDQLSRAEVILGWPGEEQIRRADALRWLQLPSAGADGYTIRKLYHNKDIMITTSRGVYGLPIAEHVFSLILAYNHNLLEYAYHQKDRRWKSIRKTRDFYGSTIGIIGLGDIGSEVAKRAKAWGARVLGVKRSISVKPEYVDALYTMESIDEVLKKSDYIVLALPHTQKTEGIISEQRLRIMKPDAFIVNIGRGPVINQDALIKALKEEWIGGAGLDVTEPEPLPADSPLWNMPNVIITPHASGNSPSNDARRMDIILRNLNHYLLGEPMENLVDFEEGY